MGDLFDFNIFEMLGNATFEVWDLFGALALLLPVLFAVGAAKRYNVIHGVMTYLFMSFLLCYFTTFGFWDKVAEKSMFFSPMVIYFANMPMAWITDFVLQIPGLDSLAGKDYVQHILLAIYLVLFVIIQLLSSLFRRKY